MGNETFKKVRLYNEDDDVLKKKRLSFLRSKHGWLLIILLNI
jgi:hypothetical protein